MTIHSALTGSPRLSADERECERAEQAKQSEQDVVANVSHDFPLAVALLCGDN